MNSVQWKMESQIGPLYLVASENGLQGIYWKKHSTPITSTLKGSNPAIKLLSQTVDELEQYFQGKRTKFEMALDLKGTLFQKQVWEQLSKIPYGKTVSYKDIAIQIKNKNAVRAVGTANGRNPISIIVPCHRVISSDGSLGGYAGGLIIKTRLLDLEQKYNPTIKTP